MYLNKKILILGAARSGMAVAKLIGKNNEVILTDLNDLSKDNEKILKDLGIQVIITDKQSDILDESFDLVIKNPGVLPHNEVILKAKKLGIKIENDIEVAYHYLPENVKIIGITGSNGKTTTITIIYELLKRMKQKVYLGGNIGVPFCDIVKNIEKDSIVLLEISDHQLLNLDSFKTNISVLTNICPTHLDYHKTYEKYKNTKKIIFNKHTNLDIAIINYDNQDSLDIIKDIPSKKIYFNNNINYFNNEAVFINNELIINLHDIKLVGEHNYENILAALLVINELYLDKKIIKEFLSDFSGVEHRIEFVNELNGVKYFNDSKSTNPVSTITALKTFNEPIHLILGGLNRNQDFNELNDYIKNVKCIYAIGEVTERIYEYAQKLNIKCEKCYELKKAVEIIKNNTDLKAGEIVLLSPASASQDQYDNYEQRGIDYKNSINNR